MALGHLGPNTMSTLERTVDHAVRHRSASCRLRIQALGELRLDRDGAPVSIVTRSQRAGPARLLEALIASGGGPIAETRLHDWLWPDLEGDRAHRAFITTLHRLRRAIGIPEAIEFAGESLSLSREHVDFDVWTFQAACGQGSGTLAQRANHALDVYGGGLLADQPAMWCLPLRERLRDRLVALILHAGEAHECRGEPDKALALYRRALEREPAIEPLFAAMMRCHLELGSPAEALRTFRRCEATLRVHYGLPPGRRTLGLLRQVDSVARPVRLCLEASLAPNALPCG